MGILDACDVLQRCRKQRHLMWMKSNAEYLYAEFYPRKISLLQNTS